MAGECFETVFMYVDMIVWSKRGKVTFGFVLAALEAWQRERQELLKSITVQLATVLQYAAGESGVWSPRDFRPEVFAHRGIAIHKRWSA